MYSFNSCPVDTVSIEMYGKVSQIEPGQSVTWSSAEKQSFTYTDFGSRSHNGPDIFIDPIATTRVFGYQNVIADFDMVPQAFRCNRPSADSVCILKSVRQSCLEQLVGGCGLPIFDVCQDLIVVNWPSFNYDNPIILTFENPLDIICQSFIIEMHVLAPIDFANSWRKE